MTGKPITDASRIDPALLAGESPFRNRLLVAMPGLTDGTFDKSVIYICAHSAAGAMGIVVNQSLPDVDFSDLLSQLHLPKSKLHVDPVVHFGGPVDTGRGFVLHSTDFIESDTVRIADDLCITATIDILSALAQGAGPRHSLFALGYAGWGPGQLEAEMQGNAWLVAPADPRLIFNPDLPDKWNMAMGLMGISPAMLSQHSGHA